MKWLVAAAIAVAVVAAIWYFAVADDDEDEATPTPEPTAAVVMEASPTQVLAPATPATVVAVASPATVVAVTEEATVQASPSVVASPSASPAASPTGSPTGSPTATVTITSKDILYEPKEVTIKADTDVTFLLPNEGAAPHNFSIDELDISVDLQPGTTEEVVINAPAGEYEIYCNVPGHREAGMVAKLIVE